MKDRSEQEDDKCMRKMINLREQKQFVVFYTICFIPLIKQHLQIVLLNKLYFTYFYSMSITDPPHTQFSTRQQSLHQLNQLFSKIQFLQLPQKEFPTEDLHRLSILTEYSIHPVFSSKDLHQFYLKIANQYWANYHKLRSQNRNLMIDNQQSIIQNDACSDVKSTKSTENHEVSNLNQDNVPVLENLENSFKMQPTETFPEQIKQVRLQMKVSKSYHEIKKFFVQFDYDYALQNQKISPKIQLLNLWTSVPCKLNNFKPKKVMDSPQKMDSATYLQNIKFGKTSRKDSITTETNRTIILGKNESTGTKQIKHMLKVQAKINFVEQKQKEEQKLDILDRKSIELTYLLNVITKEFFGDFFNDILRMLRQNLGCVNILCEKVIEKVKEQHNFIQIYVDLIKKLCKSTLTQTQDEQKLTKFNELQLYFVSYLQSNFTKLISSSVEPSSSNFNEYKYQKQMIGMSKFIGQLIKEKVLSKKIFKVCFWEIVYRYVQKVKENPENQIVNECLIEAIVTISEAMGNAELLQLMKKECGMRQCDEVIEINKFQQMIMALVSPNDQDPIERERQYNNLIDSIKVEEYPHILTGLTQIFVSKRMKLRFLVENWQHKLDKLATSTLEDIEKQKENHTRQRKQPVVIIEEPIEEELLEIDRLLKQFVTEIKQDPKINNLPQGNPPQSNQLSKYSQLIKKYVSSLTSHKDTRKFLKLLTIEFLKQFADCTNHTIIQRRIQYFIQFVDSLGIKNVSQLLVDIICEDELQNLMIIECDYPLLIEGLCLLFIHLIKVVGIEKRGLFEKMKGSFDAEDEDMAEFYQKFHSSFEKISSLKSHNQTRQD